MIGNFLAFIGCTLRETLASTTATPEQVSEAARINTEARLLALKVSIFALAGLALLAFFPAGGLPDYVRGEVPRSKAGTALKKNQSDEKSH